ncbi:MAG: Co2+/Mg2+ efflux protein ApaG [Balneolaceae bacterium]|nr:Co2+/Mg2+ efflux protein ApaG [Balneolaceae bacterium]
MNCLVYFVAEIVYLWCVMYQQTYTEISNDISVEVKPIYLQDESSPLSRQHVFAYFVTVHNMGDLPVQLLHRHWEIHDSSGDRYNVDGEGVIGKQPQIAPGEGHSYNSFCVLKSYRGEMSGYYEMEREDGSRFKARIPRFLLVSHLLN